MVWLDERMHRYRLIETARGDVRMDLLMSAGRSGAAAWMQSGADRGGHPGAAAAQALDTWKFESDRPLRLAALRHAAGHLPAGVYRAKGVIDAAEVPDHQVILHAVGRRVDLSLGPPWSSDQRRSRIATIGARGAVDGGLAAFFGDCGAAPGPTGSIG
jgi:G3E family GTPase